MAYVPFPSGTLLTFAGSSAPDGWLLCDGSAVSRTTFARLFGIISTTYGTGDGSTTFNLPDLRGVYPRGAGTNGTANYGGVTGHTPAAGALGSKGGQKTAKNGLAVSGGTATLTAGSASVTTGNASLTGTTTFSSNGHTHTEGSMIAAITMNNGDLTMRAVSGNSWAETTWLDTNVAQNSGAVPYSTGAQVTGTTSGNNSSASVGISYTAQSLSHADPTINSTAASLGTGDTETTPAFLAVNYIIKL